MEIFLAGQLTKGQACMILEVPIFCARAGGAQKFQGAQILIFLWENWHEASFYIFEIWLLKSTILDPRKSASLVFEENPPNIFHLCFSFDSALKTKTQKCFVGIFDALNKL